MNTDIASTVIIVLLLINLIGLIVVGASIRGQQAESRMMDRRLTIVEAEIKGLPTHRDLRQLQDDFGEVSESVASLGGKSETMIQLLKTIQEHLLERENRR
jgi:hypothetical protein